MRLRFDREVKISDLVSAGSLAVAALTFLVAQYQEIQTERRAYADSVRRAAIGQYEALRRVKHEAGQVYEKAQIAASGADRLLVQTGNKDRAAAMLYEAISEVRFAATASIRAENRAVSFVSLYGYSPCTGAAYDSVMDGLLAATSRALHTLVDSSYAVAIRQTRAAGGGYAGGLLRETLRTQIRFQRSHFDSIAGTISRPLEADLSRLSTASDDQIRRRRIQQRPLLSCDQRGGTK